MFQAGGDTRRVERTLCARSSAQLVEAHEQLAAVQAHRAAVENQEPSRLLRPDQDSVPAGGTL